MIRRQQDLPISTSAERAPAGFGPRAPRGGFTLVEMMVAVVILAIGLLGMVSTSAYVVRQMRGANQQAIAANVIQSRVERMRSVPCASIAEGKAITRGVAEHWVPRDSVNRVLRVVDTVTYAVGASRKKMAFTIMVPCW
jgi:type IV pilus modification protein PilV